MIFVHSLALRPTQALAREAGGGGQARLVSTGTRLRVPTPPPGGLRPWVALS
jgi:hypothetical protein